MGVAVGVNVGRKPAHQTLEFAELPMILFADRLVVSEIEFTDRKSVV